MKNKLNAEQLKKVKQDFLDEAIAYRDQIARNFYCQQGDETDTRWREQKLIDLLKMVPANQRDGMRYTALKTLLTPNKPRGGCCGSIHDPYASARKLNDWMRKLASELVEKLEKL
jgi:hypothetical protein